jgi:hypothetical protein
MKVRVGGANFDHSMLPHEGRDVKIMQVVAREVRILPREFAYHFGVTLSFHQDAK